MSDSLHPMDCSTPGFPALHYLQESAQTHVHWVNDIIQPSHPLSPPSPPALNLSQQIFSSELALHIKWPKDWSFTFSISPSNELGWFPFRIDWFDFLAVQGTLKSLLQHQVLSSLSLSPDIYTWILVILIGVWWYLIVLICISLWLLMLNIFSCSTYHPYFLFT